MLSKKIFLPLRICVPAVFAGSTLTAVSQGRLDERQSSKLESRVVQGGGFRKESFKKGLDVSLISSLAYDNNVFQTPDEETESGVLQVNPSIGWTAGSKDGTWIRLAYEGSAIVFFAQPSDNRVDNRVAVEGAVKGKNLSLAYSASWARLGSPTGDVGGTSDRDERGVNAELIYTRKGNLSYALSGRASEVDQIDPAFFDFLQSSVTVAARYEHSRKTQLEATYSLGQVEIGDSTRARQTFQRLGLAASWRPRSKLSFSVEGGVEFRDYEVGSGVDPFLTARIDWTPTAKTGVFAEFYRREDASAAVVGENLNVTGFRAGITQRLRGGWSVAIEGGVENADYFGVEGLPESGREDTVAFFRPSARYAINADTELVFLYQWRESDSSDENFGFTNQQISASLTYNF